MAEAIRALKQQPGRNINITGSVTLVRSLLNLSLLDELHLAVHPVVVGQGKRLFDDQHMLHRLRLVESVITRTGALLLHYQPLSASADSPR
jgi:dihydrofolate reductase